MCVELWQVYHFRLSALQYIPVVTALQYIPVVTALQYIPVVRALQYITFRNLADTLIQREHTVSTGTFSPRQVG